MERPVLSVAVSLAVVFAFAAGISFCDRPMRNGSKYLTFTIPREYSEALSVSKVVEEFVSSPLPTRNANVSKNAPLVFFHQRKAAGTSVMVGLHAAAVRHNLTSFIPCFDGVDCDTYTIGSARAAVYSGHLQWGDLKELTRHAQQFNASSGIWTREVYDAASCITVFRDPIARLESCYYFRWVQVNTMMRWLNAFCSKVHS